MALSTDKHWIHDLANICAQKGLTRVVFSPGSRCAPLVIAFNRHQDVECYNIIDERSAAFFALGMAQQLQQPVGLVCTSGTAALNYAPALAEAFYQRIPLVAITADRPKELIDQLDGQTLRQHNIYQNYIKKSFELPTECNTDDDLWYSNRMVSEAINTSMYPDFGPVHVNCPFREPLYELKEYPEDHKARVIESTFVEPVLPKSVEQDLMQRWNKYSRKLIVAGARKPNPQFNETINKISEDPSTVVLAEVTSNINGPLLINCLDPTLEAIPKDQLETYRPDLFVSFGGAVVSKKLKMFIRKHQPKEHWHIDMSGAHMDTYKSLTNIIPVRPQYFFDLLLQKEEIVESNYQELWNEASRRAGVDHKEQVANAPYTDLTVFDTILNHLPDNSQLQLCNSTPVRYAGLFDLSDKEGLSIYSNRGTSGIDGSVSTAAGAALVSDETVTVITGDLSFFYDSNALWNQHLPGNLRIILINNSGGNIFRIIKGPSAIDELEQFFETHHEHSAEHLAKTYDVPYYFCDDQEALKTILPDFYKPHNNKTVILEIKTPNDTSADILKTYLKIS